MFRCLFVLALLTALPFTSNADGVPQNEVIVGTPGDIPTHLDGLPPAPDVEEVVVDAPEPRYVAPTLRDRIGRVWAPVYINGRGPFRLVLDTGANSTAVTAAVASKLGSTKETTTVKLIGVTGSALVPMMRVDRIDVGDLSLTDRKVAIVPDVFGGAEGVLGGDGLSDKRIHIDFRNDQISIRRSKGAANLTGATRVPVKIRNGHLLTFDVRLAGVRTRAMLDTGAQITVGNGSLRAALAKKSKHGATNTIIGVTLDEQTGEVILIPTVGIGTATVQGMRVTFGDMYIFNAWNMTDDPALLIGMDIIGLLDTLIIDYKRKELHLRTRSPANAGASLRRR